MSLKHPHHAHVAHHLKTALAEGLTHPGDGKNGPVLLLMAGHRTTGMAPGQRDAIQQSTKAEAEAIIHTITAVQGNRIIPEAEYQALLASAQPAPEPRREALAFNCGACQQPLFTLPLLDLSRPTLNPISFAALKTSIAAVPNECTHRVTP